jgi:hypothetical protein
MSLSDDLPDFAPRYAPAAVPQNMGAMSYDSTDRVNGSGGYGSVCGSGTGSGSVSVGGPGFHDDAAGPMSDTTPSNRPTPNSSAASDHRGSSMGYTGPGAQLSPGNRSFNASPASSHHNLTANMDPGSTQGFFPQVSQMPVFAQPSSLGGDISDPTLLSPDRNLGPGLGQNGQVRGGGGSQPHPHRPRQHMQMSNRAQGDDADFTWMRELTNPQAGLNAAAGLIDMAPLDSLDMSAWGSM